MEQKYASHLIGNSLHTLIPFLYTFYFSTKKKIKQRERERGKKLWWKYLNSGICQRETQTKVGDGGTVSQNKLPRKYWFSKKLIATIWIRRRGERTWVMMVWWSELKQTRGRITWTAPRAARCALASHMHIHHCRFLIDFCPKLANYRTTVYIVRSYTFKVYTLRKSQNI